jgi:hypothetical protein
MPDGGSLNKVCGMGLLCLALALCEAKANRFDLPILRYASFFKGG